MKVYTLRNTIASGVAIEAGAVVEISDEDAHTLVRLGRATFELPEVKATVRRGKADGMV